MATPPNFNGFHGYSVPLYGVIRLEGKPVTICWHLGTAFFFFRFWVGQLHKLGCRRSGGYYGEQA